MMVGEPALEGDETGQAAVSECVADPEAPATHGRSATQPRAPKQCPRCGKFFDPRRHWQTFCSNPCRKDHFRRDAQPSIVKKVAQPPRKPREPKDGVRCRICTDWIDSREGWRINCKSCDRTRMKAWHDPLRCTRTGCILCMEATLARSTEYMAAWEAEAV
jgi:hypothetical protein